jgi:hypothetical protein
MHELYYYRLYYVLRSESQEAPEAVHSPAEAGGGVGQRVFRQRVLRLRVLQIKLDVSTPRLAKTQYRKFETSILRKRIARPQSQFPHPYVCK